MRINLSVTRGAFVAVAATALVGAGGAARAQYAPYGQAPGGGYGYSQPAAQQYGQQPQAQFGGYGYGYGQQQAQAPGTPAAQPSYPQTSTPQYAQSGVYQGYNPATGYVAPSAAPRVALNYQPPAQTPPVGQDLSLSPPTGDIASPQGETVQPGVITNGNVANGHINGQMIQPMPAVEPYVGQSYNGYQAPGVSPTPADCNCNNGQQDYATAGYGTVGYGSCDPYSGSMSQCISPKAHCGYWFGGVYGLLMDRDNSNKYALTFAAAGMPVNSYPPSPNVVLTTRNVDNDFQAGVEFRVGRTFGCAGYDPCGCSCSCGPRWGLEGVYWTLFEDEDAAVYADQGGLRTYTMMPMSGLEYNNGVIWRPVNHYMDYGPPVADYTNGGALDEIQVRLARVSTSFEVQNVEVNLLRLSLCGDGCGTCAGGYGGGCDGYGACGVCSPGSRFSCTGLLGFRYLQFDESFMYGVDFDNLGAGYPDPVDGFLNYWSTVTNDLIGAQLGCNGMYRIGCKWGVHFNTAVGLYGNDVDVRQYMISPTGNVRFISTGENFDVHATKTDVSMLGEVRLGASYQATCRCRLYGGWRAMGITGVALATEQAPTQFLDARQLGNYVNSNGSMILHGLQAGVEWNY